MSASMANSMGDEETLTQKIDRLYLYIEKQHAKANARFNGAAFVALLGWLLFFLAIFFWVDDGCL